MTLSIDIFDCLQMFMIMETRIKVVRVDFYHTYQSIKHISLYKYKSNALDIGSNLSRIGK